jgi:Protein of unknown function (DUF2490)
MVEYRGAVYCRNILRFGILFFLLIRSGITFAQSNSLGNWFIYFGNQQFSKRWNWHNEVQYRNFNGIGDLEQLLLRTGIGYNLTENNNNILLGYAFINSQPYIRGTSEKRNFNEQRIYQQYITRQNFGRVFIQHRYRIEERFLPDEFRLRFRYLLGLNVPLNKPAMSKKAVYLSLYNEIFLNARTPVFDRDRIYGAVGYVISPYLRAEVGLMTQIQETTSRTQFQIVFFNNIPFHQFK